MERHPIDEVVAHIAALPSDWHGAGSLCPEVLQAIARHVGERDIVHSVETGTGKSTLLFSHLSPDHVVFTQDDRGNGDSLDRVKSSPLLKKAEFVVGPTQVTLPQHDFRCRFQLVFMDGPHGYPFPELEYYYLYPHLEEDGLLIVDDIDIPTVHNLFQFLSEDAMFECAEVVRTTAFFRRTDAPLFSPTGDGWYRQNYNRWRFPVQDPAIVMTRTDRLRRRVPTWVKRAVRQVIP